MSKAESAMGSDPAHWMRLENNGNFGLSNVVNPRLYPFIIEYVLQSPDEVDLVDFGAGTGRAAQEILYAQPEENAGILAATRLGLDIQEARRKIRSFRCFEGNARYVKAGKLNTRALEESRGMPGKIDLQKLDLSRQAPPIADSSIDLALSRHVLMHLSGHELALHLKEVQRILKNNRHYLATVLNPDYEQKKYEQHFPSNPPLLPEQRYSYPHGNPGAEELLDQVWRPVDYYTKHFETNGFSVESADRLFGDGPVDDRYRRYFSPTTPMGLMFALQNRVPESRQEWYTIDIRSSCGDILEGRLDELLQQWKQRHNADRVPEEVVQQLLQQAQLEATSALYNRKYGPNSNFAEEHRRKLEHPEIGETFRRSLRLLRPRKGHTVVNMGVNDGYELNVFNQLSLGKGLLDQLHIYGIDVADEALQVAHESFPNPQHRFVHGNGRTLEGTDIATKEPIRIPDGAVDLYMAITAIQSTSLKEHWDEVFANIFRVLHAKKGKVLIAIPNCFYRGTQLVNGRFDAESQNVDHRIARLEVQEICDRLEHEGFQARTLGQQYIFISASKAGFSE